MTSFERGLVVRRAALPCSLALAALAAGCAQQGTPPGESATEPVAVTQQASALDDLAMQCGLSCPDKGIADGNASISGVVSVDAFFQAVLDFQAKAGNVAAAIDAQLAAIRGDFGIDAATDLDAGITAQITANLDGKLMVDAEPAKCSVDAQATLQAQAHCDAKVNPGSATVKCSGSCDVQASAKVDCGANATLKCTVSAPSVSCSGTCQGSCETMISGSAACDGTCHGSCSGTCSAYVKDASGNAQCSGTCSGNCQGSCEVKLAAEASCSGACNGQCTSTPPDGNCQGGIKASCEANANAMVDCKGSCEGDVEPPSASAECNASAKAEAKLNVQCTPPRVAISYSLKAGVDATAQAKFVAAVKNLEVRLPALLAAIKQAQSVAAAGVGLTGDGKAAVQGAVMASAGGAADAKTYIGLGCALTELGDVSAAIQSSTDRLSASLTASLKVQTALLGS